MSFKPIRTFLENRLLEVDSDFQEHYAAFDLESVPSTNDDKRFHIFYGNVTTTTANQNTTDDTVNAVVTLWFSGQRETKDILDDAMDLANEFRINCLRQQKLSGQTFIKRVVSQSIVAEPLNTNDGSFRIILSFSIRVIFGTNVNLD